MSFTGRNRLVEKNYPTAARNGESFWILVGLAPGDDGAGEQLTVTRATYATFGQRRVDIPLAGPTEVTSTNGSFMFDGLVFEGRSTSMWPIKFTLRNNHGHTLGAVVIRMQNPVAVAPATNTTGGNGV